MSLKIHVRQVPPTGGRWQGEDKTVLVELQDFGVLPLGPLTYALEGGISKGGFFATGSLILEVSLQCVTCLHFFEYKIHIEDFALQIELEGRESVDLTPHVREDILLALPSYPRCDSTSNQSCSTPFVTKANPVESKQHMLPTVWEVLKKLNLKKNF